MALQWYAAHTKPLAEYAAQSRLQGAGIEVFLPCAKTPKPRPGHWNTPLFPGYLFLRYDMEKGGLRQLRKMPQLVGMVTFQGTVPPVPDQVISDLAERVETLNAFGGVWTRYRTGERVTVSLGPVESLARVVSGATSPQARVRVLLEFMGRMVEAKVPWRHVQPVGHGSSLIGDRNGRPRRRTRGRGRWINGFGPREAAVKSPSPVGPNNGVLRRSS